MPKRRSTKPPAKAKRKASSELSERDLDEVSGGTHNATATLASPGEQPAAAGGTWAWHETVLQGDIVAARKSG